VAADGPRQLIITSQLLYQLSYAGIFLAPADGYYIRSALPCQGLIRPGEKKRGPRPTVNARCFVRRLHESSSRRFCLLKIFMQSYRNEWLMKNL